MKFAKLTDLNGHPCYLSESLLLREPVAGEQQDERVSTIITNNLNMAVRETPDQVAQILAAALSVRRRKRK